MTDSGRYLMKMVHNCSSNRQIGMILVAKCNYCICLQLVSAILPCIRQRNHVSAHSTAHNKFTIGNFVPFSSGVTLSSVG